MPSLSVVHTVPSTAQERRARAFLAAETERAVEQPVDEPFESDRNLVQLAAQPRGTRSIIALLTTVLPTAALRAPFGRLRNR